MSRPGAWIEPPELLPASFPLPFQHGVLEAVTLPSGTTRYRVFPQLEPAQRSAVRHLLRERPTTLQLVRVHPVLWVAPVWNTAMEDVTGEVWT